MMKQRPALTVPRLDQPTAQRRLLRWYRRNRRDLPWRRTRDPYRIWLSEMMLQQTQVATVLPYYERFTQRFPTVQSLADAPLDDVLRLWAGLGYYARARNLHAAAQRIADKFTGAFPTTIETLLDLPGVGRYTAAAVASIAFGRRAAVLDGNVARVLARLFAIRRPLKSAAVQRRLWKLADVMLPARNCGDHNQAMMELGATVCTPAAPRCDRCPLAANCEANRRGLVDRIPIATPRAAPRLAEFVVAAIESDGRWLFEARDRRGLWGGLWQLPSQPRADGRPTRRIAAELAVRLGLKNARVSPLPVAVIERRLTHRLARFIVHRCHTRSPRSFDENATSTRTLWLPPAMFDDLAISAAMRHVLTHVSAIVTEKRRPARL